MTLVVPLFKSSKRWHLHHSQDPNKAQLIVPKPRCSQSGRDKPSKAVCQPGKAAEEFGTPCSGHSHNWTMLWCRQNRKRPCSVPTPSPTWKRSHLLHPSSRARGDELRAVLLLWCFVVPPSSACTPLPSLTTQLFGLLQCTLGPRARHPARHRELALLFFHFCDAAGSNPPSPLSSVRLQLAKPSSRTN